MGRKVIGFALYDSENETYLISLDSIFDRAFIVFPTVYQAECAKLQLKRETGKHFEIHEIELSLVDKEV